MTSVDPALEPTVITDPEVLRAARRAGLVAATLLGEPGVIGVAVLRAPQSPTVVARAATLPRARSLAAALGCTWHTQATGSGAGSLWVHAFEGVRDGLPLTVYALGDRDDDPDVGTCEGAAGLAMLLAGLIL